MKDDAQPEPHRRFRAFLRYRLPAIIWSVLLLLLSTALLSSQATGMGLATFFYWLIGREAAPATIAVTNVVLRKLAHLVAYGTEGALMLRAARSGRTGRETRWMMQALGWTLLVASLDEFNQTFSPFRTGSPKDVLLDMTGAVLAVLLFRKRGIALSVRRAQH